jgi:hypothetical protein
MNKDSIINQLKRIEASISRAKVPFEIDLVHPNTITVTVWELMKAIKQAENIISEITIEYPEIKQSVLK